MNELTKAYIDTLGAKIIAAECQIRAIKHGLINNLGQTDTQVKHLMEVIDDKYHRVMKDEIIRLRNANEPVAEVLNELLQKDKSSKS